MRLSKQWILSRLEAKLSASIGEITKYQYNDFDPQKTGDNDSLNELLDDACLYRALIGFISYHMPKDKS